MCSALIRLSVVFLLLPVLSALASECRYGQKELTRIDSDRYSEQTMDYIQKDTYGDDWACIMKERNLKRDNLKGCLPPEDLVLNFMPEKKIEVKGSLRYMGMISQSYNYDVSPTGIEVRIAFQGELGSDPKALEQTKAKLAYASAVWTRNSPEGKIFFEFKLVTPDENPHFMPKLSKKNNGTKFNTNWDINDTKEIVAHEVGHMVGLDDEYSVVRSVVWQVKNEVDTRMCNLRSLMCDYYSPNPKLYSYVYYQIMRRPYCLTNK